MPTGDDFIKEYERLNMVDLVVRREDEDHRPPEIQI
jgi:hypothetical protein